MDRRRNSLANPNPMVHAAIRRCSMPRCGREDMSAHTLVCGRRGTRLGPRLGPPQYLLQANATQPAPGIPLLLLRLRQPGPAWGRLGCGPRGSAFRGGS